MAMFREIAFKKLLDRQPIEVKKDSELTSDYYGSMVFDRPKMKKYLSKNI